MRFDGKTVFITGSSRGIGHAMLEAFVKEGACVYANARKETEAFSTELERLRSQYHADIRPVYFDVTDTAAMKEAVRAIHRSKTPVDVLVNNAGVIHTQLFQMTPIAQVRELFETNLFSMMELTQLISKIMTRQKHGCIINMASIAGVAPQAGDCAYGVSKAGVIALTKTLSAELAPLGIRVNAIAPGVIATDMATQIEQTTGKDEKALVQTGHIRRLGTPEEVAATAVFLASEEASYITGQVIHVNGGMI